ncbi:MAG: transcription termination factor Rho [Lachnospiraceae bacterium]|nr:transcription termination factor Rho [Lachnospiraceae bacterium]
MTEYEKLTLVELRLAAKKLGIKNVTTFKKKELLDKIQEVVGNDTTTSVSQQKNDSDAEDIPEKPRRGRKPVVMEPEEPEEVEHEMVGGYVPERESMRNSGYMREPDMGMNRGGYNRNEGMNRGGYNRNEGMNRGGYNRNEGMNRGGYNRNEGVNRGGYNRNEGMSRGGYNRNEGMNRGDYSRNEGMSRGDYARNEGMSRGDYARNEGMNRGDYSSRGQDADRSRYMMREMRDDNRSGYRTEIRNSQPRRMQNQDLTPTEIEELDSGIGREGILEVLSEGYGFIRCDNYLPGERDVYVSPALIRKYNLRTGDILNGNIRIRNQNEKFAALLYLKEINGCDPDSIISRPKFEHLTPVFPDERLRLETAGCPISMRMMDLIAPIGKGQRGMIVSQPKTGKTTLLKQVAKAVKTNHPKMHLIVLLIDERPEEVTDIKESIIGHNVEVIFSTFDELPENHKRVSEMVIERAKRLVEQGEEVMILLDSITRLARAYNLTVQPSGRTLSGGLDPAALHMPKRFFGAARNMREGGSLTILATALVDTGSKMDDVVFEEFKGTGNMELVLDRKLSEKRVFPAIDLPRSSTRRDDLLLTQEEVETNFLMRRALSGTKSEEAVERIIEMFRRTKSNQEFIQMIRKTKIV